MQSMHKNAYLYFECEHLGHAALNQTLVENAQLIPSRQTRNISACFVGEHFAEIILRTFNFSGNH